MSQGTHRQLIAGLQPLVAHADLHFLRVEDLMMIDESPAGQSFGRYTLRPGVRLQPPAAFQLTKVGSHEWLMYSRSLFRSKYLFGPACTVA